MLEPRNVEDWKLISKLGAGTFGEVSLWRNEVTEDCLAIKKCRMEMPESISSRQRERWMSEVEIMKNICNKNIVSFKMLPEILFDHLNKYNPSKLPLLSMEYCSKGNLRTFLKQPKHQNGLLETEVKFLLLDISNAIGYLHSLNITHRDIKPENIVLQHDPNRSNKTIYKVIDLGYAKELQSIGLSFVGTLAYVAPEIFKTQKYDRTVDYWSFGNLVHEVITGQLPFLPFVEPVKRFDYISKKTNDDICIYIDKKKICYSKEISEKNFISKVLKNYIEDWLRLVLRYNPTERGVKNGTTIDVIDELKHNLSKKIIKVYSVYNCDCYFYELTNKMSFKDLKSLLCDDTNIAKEDQFIVHDNSKKIDVNEDYLIIDFVKDSDGEIEFFLFKKDSFVDKNKEISIPKELQPMDSDNQNVKIFFRNFIYFILKENIKLDLFKKSLKTVNALTVELYEKQRTLFSRVREKMFKLLSTVEFNAQVNPIDENDHKDYLIQYRSSLRQIKELAENCNNMTERFIKVTDLYESLQLDSIICNLSNLDVICNEVIQSSQKISSTNDQVDSSRSTYKEGFLTLSKVIKILCNTYMNRENADLCLLAALKFLVKIEKLITCSSSIDDEIERLSREFVKLNASKAPQRVPPASVDSLSIILPFELNVSSRETEELLKENTELRYLFLDKLNESSTYLRSIEKESFATHNGFFIEGYYRKN